MDDNEQFVRARWEHVCTSAAALHLSDYSAPLVITHAGEFANFAEARAFTEARLKAIADQKDDVKWVASCIKAMESIVWEGLTERDAQFAAEQLKRGRRVLSREQSVLAALKFGMREE